MNGVRETDKALVEAFAGEPEKLAAYLFRVLYQAEDALDRLRAERQEGLPIVPPLEFTLSTCAPAEVECDNKGPGAVQVVFYSGSISHATAEE